MSAENGKLCASEEENNEENLKKAHEDIVSLQTDIADKSAKLTAMQNENSSLRSLLGDKENELTASQKMTEHFKSLLDKETTKHTKGNAILYYLSKFFVIVKRF